MGQRFLASVVYNRLGKRHSEVAVGPGPGLDTSIIALGRGRALVTTTDPLSLVPSIGPRDSAWLSAHLIASDIATSGFLPSYGIFNFNLPPSIEDSVFASYWKSFHEVCTELGLAIIGGHTGRYVGCDYTIIGAGVMMTVAQENQVLTSSMGKVGDDIILTKGAAIETTAVLTRAYPQHMRKALGAKLFDRAWKYLRKVTVVMDALTAASVGIHDRGVTAMHDATEGGVIAAALELAIASETGLSLDTAAIKTNPETDEICKLFRMDPMTSLSEGSLVISSKPSATSKIINRLSSKGIEASAVGRLLPKSRGYWSTSKSGISRLNYPKADPYWKAFDIGRRRNWN